MVLHLDRPVDAAALAPLGRVVTHDTAEAVLQVTQGAVNATVTRALATLPVRDLTVENAPLEEVMSELFARSRAAREAEQEASVLIQDTRVT